MPATDTLESALKNRQWIESRLGDLGKNYSGKYIAVANQQVVAVGASIGEVKRVLRSRSLSLFPDCATSGVTITYLSNEPSGMLL
jgi:hypothetical protein